MATKTMNVRLLQASDTTANLTGSTKVWLKGETIYEFCADGSIKMKIGNGVDVWDDLPYFTTDNNSGSIEVVQGDTTDPDTAWSTTINGAAGNNPTDGFMLIIQDPAGGTAGYIYNSTSASWIAFSGNVMAENVWFSEDITCAGDYTQVGNVTKTKTGTTTINAANKSLADVMTKIFTKELQPTKTEPAVTISFTQAGEYEVGTTITPSYTATLSSGSYTYGPATGVAASTWTIEDSDGNSSSNASDSFPSIVVTDTTNYTIKATADHNEGTVANTNLGNTSDPVVKIASGSKNKTSSAVTSYRARFYGVVDDVNALDSNAVRGLTHGGKARGGKVTVEVNGDTNAKRIIVAVPTSSGLGVTNVMKTDGLATDITSTYSKTETVMVDGCGSTPDTVSYDIWTYQPAKIDSAEVHEITIG